MTAMISILSFCAVFLGVFGVFTLISGKRRGKEYADNLPAVFRIFQTETRYLSYTLGKTLANHSPGITRQWRGILLSANLTLSVEDIYGSRILWCTISCATGLLMAIFLSEDTWTMAGAGLTGAFLGFQYPAVTVRKAADERRKSIRKDLPFAIDLIASAMRAGLDFIAAVRYYTANSAPGPLVQEFGAVLKEIELGKSRVDALRSMSERIQLEEFKGLVTAVSEGAEMGASIVDTLCVHAAEIRHARFAAAERQAQRAPSLMLIPMALFIMPAVFIIIFTPVFIRIQESGFSQMMQ